MKVTGLPALWAAWSGAPSVPVSAALLVRSRACSVFPTIATIATVTAITTAITDSVATGESTAVIPERDEVASPESIHPPTLTHDGFRARATHGPE